MTADKQLQSNYLQGVSGQYAGKKLPVDEALIIGSDSSVEVTIDDPAIRSRHIRIVADGTRMQIENLTEADQIWVNGVPVKQASLSSGDEIRVGQQRFVVKIPGLRPDSVLRDISEHQQYGKRWLVWAGIAVTMTVVAVAYYLLR